MKICRDTMMEAFRERKYSVRYPVYGSCTDKRWMSNARDLRFGYMAFTDESLVCLRHHFMIEVIEIPLLELQILWMKRGWFQRRVLIRDRRSGKRIELRFCKKVLCGDFTEQPENSEMFWKYCTILWDNS